MDNKSIQEILRFVNKSNLSEVEIEQKDFKLKIRRKSSENVVYSTMPVAQPGQPPAIPVPMEQKPPVSDAPPAKETDNSGDEGGSELYTFKSPMIGTFYRAPTPDKDPYIKVGDSISSGQVVCIVEAMKLFNEIESDIEGKIVKILLEDAQPVEYDQPLFLIELN